MSTFLGRFGIVLGLLVCIPGDSLSFADDASMRAAISRLARLAAVDAAKSFRMDFDEPKFRGSVVPVDVDDNFQVTLSRFELTEDRITAELETALPFQVEGQVTVRVRSQTDASRMLCFLRSCGG